MIDNDTGLGRSARSVLDRNTAGEDTTGLFLGLISQAGKGDILPWDKGGIVPRETGRHRRRRWPRRRANASPACKSETSPYAGTSEITGKLHTGNEIKHTRTLSRSQRVALHTILGASLACGLALLSWIGWRTYIAVSTFPARSADVIVIGGLLVLIEGSRITQSCTLGYLAAMARDPVPLIPETNYRIAILTTIVPGKEPWAMVKTTLQAMKKIRYPGIIDVWILDEGNDPVIKKESALIGVRHFSRHGENKWNTPSGAFRRKSKSGNHNSWRDRYEDQYDIVAQMDPDHIPVPEFIERTIGYFNDPDTGFVVAPQVYGRNMAHNWIARASAVQAYIFHGIVQRGLNGLRAPLLIGTNHLYRTTCWRQIGGYQDALIEDHRTAIEVYATTNPSTGNRWKGLYTPDIIADGEGPTSFTDYFNQQQRWAYGIWQVMVSDSPHMLPKLSARQQFGFAILQWFYPSICITWLSGMALTVLFIFSGVPMNLPLVQWAALWPVSYLLPLMLFFWLRRFNLAEHERRKWGVPGLLLSLMTIPVYVQAGLAYCFGCPLGYAVTAKGDLATADRPAVFRWHIVWALAATAFFVLPFFGIGSNFATMHIWMGLALAAFSVPVVMHYYNKFQTRERVKDNIDAVQPGDIAGVSY